MRQIAISTLTTIPRIGIANASPEVEEGATGLGEFIGVAVADA
jgi:hypothetical protein